MTEYCNSAAAQQQSPALLQQNHQNSPRSKRKAAPPHQQYKMEYMQHSNDEEEEGEVGPECPMNHTHRSSSAVDSERHDFGLKFKTAHLGAPIFELRGREVIFAIAVFFLFSLCVGLVIVLATTKPAKINTGAGHSARSDELCLSGPCMSKAVYMMNALNNTSDPCDNFYEYACTGWLTSNMLPPDEQVYSIDTVIRERLDNQLHVLLTELGPPTVQHGPQSAYTKARLLYDKCMDVREMDRAGKEPIMEAITHLGGWALTEDWREISGQWNLQEVIERLQFIYLTNSLFSIYVAPDDKYSDVWAIQIDQGGLGLPDSSMYHSEDAPDDGEAEGAPDEEGPPVGASVGNPSAVGESAEDGNPFDSPPMPPMYDMGEGEEGEEEHMRPHNPGEFLQREYKKYIYNIGAIFQQDRNKVLEFVNVVYGIEKKIAAISTSETSNDRRDPNLNYNNISIGELQLLTPRIDWLRLLNKNFYSLNRHSRVIVKNRQYMSDINSLMNKIRPRDMNMFMVWKLVSNFALYLSRPFRKASNDFHALLDSTSTNEPRWRSCLREVDDWFGMAVGAMFVERHFPPEAKQDVSEMVTNIREVFRESLQNITWMDEKTRARALHKLDAIEHRVGYPEFLTNWTFVDDYYSNFHVTASDTYFETQLNGNHNEVTRMRVDINRHQSNVDDWGIYPHVINAFYAYTQNRIIFPAGILQDPYYDSRVPEYINYGTIGTTIGHELTHAFDTFGAQYNDKGSLEQWWTDESWEEFNNRTKCVEKHYSSYTLQNITIDGVNTLGENLADIVGVQHAYKAYEKWRSEHGEEKMLPGVDLSIPQMFFVSYAQMWCTKHTPEHLNQYQYGDNHAPPAIRVLGTLSQIEEFSEAFNCPAKSAMNSEEKCDVW